MSTEQLEAEFDERVDEALGEMTTQDPEHFEQYSQETIGVEDFDLSDALSE